jgi:hypothetical protein
MGFNCQLGLYRLAWQQQQLTIAVIQQMLNARQKFFRFRPRAASVDRLPVE